MNHFIQELKHSLVNDLRSCFICPFSVWTLGWIYIHIYIYIYLHIYIYICLQWLWIDRLAAKRYTCKCGHAFDREKVAWIQANKGKGGRAPQNGALPIGDAPRTVTIVEPGPGKGKDKGKGGVTPQQVQEAMLPILHAFARHFKIDESTVDGWWKTAQDSPRRSRS